MEGPSKIGWWSQIGSFPQAGLNIKKYLKPPPRKSQSYTKFMFWKANGNGTSTMIVDALIVTSRNFKSIFVYQRFHVPPCAQETALFFATSFSQKSSTVSVWLAANMNWAKLLNCFQENMHILNLQPPSHSKSNI